MKKKKKLDRKACDALLLAFEEKYCDLVWYYRTMAHRPGIGKTDPGFDKLVEIRAKYPNDCAHLLQKDGSWLHGFNSGCLASCRYASGLRHGRLEQDQAIADYPSLDT